MCAGECECLCAHTPVCVFDGFDELVAGVAQIHVQKPHLLEVKHQTQWCLVVAPVAGAYL